MGDILGLIEKAEEVIDQEEAAALEKKLRKEELTLETFRDQIRMMKKMGPLSGIVSMLPGMGNIREADLDSCAMVRALAIVDSMTPRERLLPQLLNGSRKKRIARGSGQSVQEINRLLKQFAQMKRMMKTIQATKGRKGARLPFFGR
jgi:signal recognition particle subunit SRP54